MRNEYRGNTPKRQGPTKAKAPGSETIEERRARVAAARGEVVPTGDRAESESAASADTDADDEANDTDLTDSSEHEGLPTLDELEAHLATIESADEVKALRKSDKRKGAKPMYKARLDELKSLES